MGTQLYEEFFSDYYSKMYQQHCFTFLFTMVCFVLPECKWQGELQKASKL